MNKYLIAICQVTKRELNRMTSRWMYFLVVLLFPVLTILFFASLFKDGVPTKMPIAIVDLDQTTVSRKFARTIDVTPLSRVAMNLSSEEEALSEMRKGTIYGFVLLPHDLEADIMASRQPVISYYYQNSLLIAGGLLQNDLTYTLHTLSGGVQLQKLQAMGVPEKQTMAQIQPIQVNVHQLFNPMANYSVYISTIVLPIMMQLFILLITVYSIGIEIRERSSREWLRLSHNSLVVALTGKLLPYTVIFSVVMFFQNFMLYKVMKVPILTGTGWLVLASLLFILAYQAIGIFFISLLPMMRHALNLAAFYGILALTLCGFSFPIESMPSVFQFWADGFPVRHFMHIFQSQILAGFGIHYAFWSYIKLMIFLLLPFTVTMQLKSALIYQNYIEVIEKN